MEYFVISPGVRVYTGFGNSEIYLSGLVLVGKK